jgi:uncharacterized damage-inducible protein DinB
MMDTIQVIQTMLEEAYHGPAWHGPHLRGALRGISAKSVVRRPDRSRHNIAEIAVHCAYWKYAACRRLTGEKRGSFPIKGSNWFTVQQLSDADWKDYLQLLDNTHARLREAVINLPTKRLDEIPQGARVTNIRLLYGMALHDVYHAGQIRLLKSEDLLTQRRSR